MKTLHNYLTRQVLAALLLSMAIFTFVFLVGDGLKEILPLLIRGQIQFSLVLEAIGLLIPFLWVYALPMSLLTATLLIFGRFSADQELTAARAGGISLLSLITPILLMSLFCCGLSAWINMDLGPRSRVAFKELTFRTEANYLTRFQLPENQFFRDIPGYIIHVDKNHGGDLADVTVYALPNQTNIFATITAPKGQFNVDMQKRQLNLNLFNAQTLMCKNDGSSINTFFKGWSSYTFPLPAHDNHHYHPALSDMTFWQLRDELKNLNRKLRLASVANTKANETTRAQLRVAEKQVERLREPIRVEMNREVAFSFACFSFTLIGIPLGIRVHRRETNIGVAIALGLVLVYYAFNVLGESLSARPEFAPHLIFWVPNFIFQAVGAALLWRANRGI